MPDGHLWFWQFSFQNEIIISLLILDNKSVTIHRKHNINQQKQPKIYKWNLFSPLKYTLLSMALAIYLKSVKDKNITIRILSINISNSFTNSSTLSPFDCLIWARFLFWSWCFFLRCFLLWCFFVWCFFIWSLFFRSRILFLETKINWFIIF